MSVDKNFIPNCLRYIHAVSGIKTTIEYMARNYKYYDNNATYDDFAAGLLALICRNLNVDMKNINFRKIDYDEIKPSQFPCESFINNTSHADILNCCYNCEKSTYKPNKYKKYEFAFLNGLVHDRGLSFNTGSDGITSEHFTYMLERPASNGTVEVLRVYRHIYDVMLQLIYKGIVFTKDDLYDHLMKIPEVKAFEKEVRAVIDEIYSYPYNSKETQTAIETLIGRTISISGTCSNISTPGTQTGSAKKTYLKKRTALETIPISGVITTKNEKDEMAGIADAKSGIDNSIISSVNPTFTNISETSNQKPGPVVETNKDENILTKETENSFADVTEKIYEDVSIDDITIIRINNADEYNLQKNDIMGCGMCSLLYYTEPDTMLVVTLSNSGKGKAYIIKINGLEKPCLNILLSEEVIKLVNSIIPFGNVFSPYAYRFKYIYELFTIEQFLEEKFMYSQYYDDINREPMSFDESSINSYIIQGIGLLNKFKRIKNRKNKHLASHPFNRLVDKNIVDIVERSDNDSSDKEKRRTPDIRFKDSKMRYEYDFRVIFPLYDDIFRISLLACNSYPFLHNFNAKNNEYKFIKINIMNRELKLASSHYYPVKSMESIPVKSWLVEKILVCLTGVDILKRGMAYLYEYTDNSFTLICKETNYPYVYQALRIVADMVFKTIIRSDIKADIEIITKI